MNKQFIDKLKQNKIFEYILPPIITAILFCLVLIIKGIYPFGKNPIDYYDLSAQIVTYYVHIWDSLHGSKNIFYDCYSALSTSMVTTCGSSSFSVFNLFLLFIKRENILKCMSIFLLIKMMVMSFSMNFFLKKSLKINKIFTLIFSVLYSFSGFVLMHYTIMEWMDIAALFPFVMAGLFSLLKEEKNVFYTLMLTLSIISGYYLSVMMLIYIFLMVGMVIITGKIFKEKNTFPLFKLLISTIAAIFISFFILLPQIAQTTASARFTNESSSGLFGMYMDILSNVKPAYTSRWFVIAGISLCVSIIVAGMIRFRKDTLLITRTVFASLIMCAELFFENICLFWHYGSYVHYPIRNGFMITFTLIYLAGLYLQKFEGEEGIFEENNKGFSLVIILGIIFSVIILSVLIIFYKNNSGMEVRKLFHILALFMAALSVIYFSLFVIKKGKYINLIPVIVAMEVIFYGYIFLGQPTFITGYAEEPEMERNSFYICNELRESLNFSDRNISTTDRIKNPDTSLNANYPIILERSALSNWTALIPPSLQESAEKLGYSIQYTRLLDSGGTVFSDALLGVKNIISCLPQNEELYELANTVSLTADRSSLEKKDYYYYNAKYSLPFLIPVKDIDKVDFENEDIVSLYNQIYHSISGSDANVNISEWVTDFDFSSSSDYSKKTEERSISVSGKKALYYIGNQLDSEDYNISFNLNGEAVLIPSIGEMNNELYPAHFNNNCVLLGVFSDETIELEVECSSLDKNGNKIEGILEKDIKGKVFSLDLDLLAKLCEKLNDVSEDISSRASYYDISFNNTLGADSVLIPLSYDEGYKVKVNDRSEKAGFAGGLFMTIPVNDLENKISIGFVPHLLKEGIIISLISLALFILFCVFIKKTGKIDNVLEYIYIFAFSFCIFVMYLVPIIYSVIKTFIS